MDAALARLADQVVARHGAAEDLALIGIQRRGADLAERLQAILEDRLDHRIPLGKLDINLYRDDWSDLQVQPTINCSEIPFDIMRHKVILVDDVLFTGRTIRAALEAILDYGRPRRVELLVLVDRGHRELPIQPDYVGKAVATEPEDHVNVFVRERDDEDHVCLVRPTAA
jgi:pyrimidine operon attenuation protein/uracil phosphoribosyltransferase